MFKGFYAGVAGMLVQQTHSDVIANNLANVDTVGFRRRKMVVQSFPHVLIERLEPGKELPFVGPVDIVSNRQIIGRMGTAQVVSETFMDKRPGIIDYNDNPLNLSIQDESFFSVQDENGNTFYTRAGNFTIDNAGGIVNQDGFRVLGDGGAPLNIGEATKVEFNDAGQLIADGEIVGQVQTFTFDRPTMLRQAANNLYTTNDYSGEPQAVAIPSLQARSLEKSNVEVVDEMVKMIEAHRTYEAASRMVQIHDQSISQMFQAFGKG